MAVKKILSNYKGIIESTLREGQQFRGANFSIKQQIEIVKFLKKIGIERIEVGNPISKQKRKEILILAQIKNRPPLIAHIRCRISDALATVDVGIDGINLLCTVDSKRLKGMNISLNQHIKEMRRCILLAKQHKLEVRVSVEHYFSQDNNNAMKIFKAADALKVDRIGVADTVGTALPWRVAQQITQLHKHINADIEVHFHDELGHSTSNVLAALTSGASWVDTTIAGIGERTGITPLSKFLLNLYRIDNNFTDRYKYEMLTHVENKVLAMIGKEVPFNLMTNTNNGFNHKAGIHIRAILKHGLDQYELLPPSLIGNNRSFEIGTPISGKTTQKEIDVFNNNIKINQKT